MKIIIAGAYAIGTHLARLLSRNHEDITLIDPDPDRLARIGSDYDLLTMVADPDSVGSHDWAMFYVAPHGWMFADPSFGGSAFRAGSELRHKHYFGNLDIYRNVTTNAFQADFEPCSRFWRHDPYDNQVGEVEDSRRGYPGRQVRHTIEMVSLEELED